MIGEGTEKHSSMQKGKRIGDCFAEAMTSERHGRFRNR